MIDRLIGDTNSTAAGEAVLTVPSLPNEEVQIGTRRESFSRMAGLACSVLMRQYAVPSSDMLGTTA